MGVVFATLFLDFRGLSTMLWKKKKARDILRAAYYTLTILLVGFAGGVLAPLFIGWLTGIKVSPSDAVSIANTYIVFTTIIFVGFTVFLSVAIYIFTQQFTEAKQSQVLNLFEDLRESFQTDENLGIKLVTAILENSDVKSHVDDQFRKKITQIIWDLRQQQRKAAQDIEATGTALDGLADSIEKNGNGGKK